MGTVGIVVGLIFRQFLIDGKRTLVERVELIATGAVGALHTAMGFFGGSTYKGMPASWQACSNFPEFRAAVHLERADQETVWHCGFQVRGWWVNCRRRLGFTSFEKTYNQEDS